MSSAFPGNVETSANLASVRTQAQAVEIVVSVRSSAETQLDAQLERVCARAHETGGTVEIRDRYPAWQPNLSSPLLNLAEKTFRRVRGKPPLIQVVHGGLECGLIVSKIPEMDAISIGPLIRFAHTPQECVNIPSVATTWKLLITLLEAVNEAGSGALNAPAQQLQVAMAT